MTNPALLNDPAWLRPTIPTTKLTYRIKRFLSGLLGWFMSANKPGPALELVTTDDLAATIGAQHDDQSFTRDAVDAHYRTLYQYALSLTKSDADARDLTQETILTLMKKGSQLRDKEKVRSWLYTTLYRHFVRQHHGRRREEAFDDTVPEHVPTIPARQAAHVDGSLVMNCLHKLEEGHRAVITLYYLEDLSYKEIALSLQMPIGTVMSRLSRAKEMLRAELIA